MSQQSLILGSSSRYRQSVLKKLGIPFQSASPDIDETRLANEAPKKLVQRLSEAKAREIAKKFPDALIIGCDQVASFGDTILTKPGDYENAIKQLTLMSGNEIVFHSGLCLLNSKTHSMQVDVVDFTVVMRDLSSAQIENYVKKDQPYDSAGSFKSEGLGIALFERMSGDDPNSLIGLPLIRLVSMLAHEKFYVL